MISGFLISNKWSPLLFISEVKAGSISTESGKPPSYGYGHPGLLLSCAVTLSCPKLTVSSAWQKLPFPYPSHSQRWFFLHCPAEIHTSSMKSVIPSPLPLPLPRWGRYQRTYSANWYRRTDDKCSAGTLAFLWRENSLEITSGIPTAEIIFCRKFLTGWSFWKPDNSYRRVVRL